MYDNFSINLAVHTSLLNLQYKKEKKTIEKNKITILKLEIFILLSLKDNSDFLIFLKILLK